MKLTTREIVSLALGLGGVAMLGIAISHLLDTGTCGSGGPYVTARECPEGSAVWGLALPVGFFVWLTSLFVSKAGLAKPGAGQIVWTVGFLGGGLALLFKAFTQTLGADANLGIYIMASIFIPAGIAIWIPAFVRFSRERRASPTSPQPAKTGAVVGGHVSRRVSRTGPADNHDKARMRQLNQLRSSGALTRAEFDRLKRDPARPARDGSHEPAADKLAVIRQLAELKASGILTPAEFEAKKQTVILGDLRRTGEAAD
ncbi:SHOCT domain-containing protein [Dactylosporangium sp. CS-033363]|uniref:SHOCT domain-containing protein n=1 Tax=Dactylosporangium sp. CS-033363 TaxID=3239935 RepID=UPI003D8DB8A3